MAGTVGTGESAGGKRGRYGDNAEINVTPFVDIMLVLLIVLMVVNHPERMMFYATMATLGSITGCLALYFVGRRGGEALLRKRFSGGNVERAASLMRKYGAMALIVPALLPPPAPFKIFVLMGGVANIPLPTFIWAIALGRGVRYFGEGILAVMYGQQAIGYLQENGRTVALAIGLLALAGGIAYYAWKRRRQRT